MVIKNVVFELNSVFYEIKSVKFDRETMILSLKTRKDDNIKLNEFYFDNKHNKFRINIEIETDDGSPSSPENARRYWGDFRK